jgi:hypothetical protein
MNMKIIVNMNTKTIYLKIKEISLKIEYKSLTSNKNNKPQYKILHKKEAFKLKF